MKPLIIAHRGDTIDFPENTIAAFKSAFDKGADGVELDVHLNKRGEVIVVHDYAFDKNTKYPLLNEVLSQFGQAGTLEIEIKSLDPECVKKVSDLIKEYSPKDYEITTSILPLFPYIKKEFPKSKIGLIHAVKLIESWMTDAFIEDLLLSYLRLTGANVLHLKLEYFTPEIVKKLHENNYLAHSHLKDASLEDYKKILNLKLDQFTLDDIKLLKKII